MFFYDNLFIICFFFVFMVSKISRSNGFWYIRYEYGIRKIKVSKNTTNKKQLLKYIYKLDVLRSKRLDKLRPNEETTEINGRPVIVNIPTLTRSSSAKRIKKLRSQRLKGLGEVWYPNVQNYRKGYLHIGAYFYKGKKRYSGTGRSYRLDLKREFNKAFNNALRSAWINSNIRATTDYFEVFEMFYIYVEDI